MKNYSIKFNLNGGTGLCPDQEVSEGSYVVAPSNPTREGYIFAGWYTDESYTTEWDFETDTVVDNLYLYAKWEETADYYKEITFVNDNEMMQVIVKNGDIVALKEYVNMFDKEGYEVLGWNTTGDKSDVEYTTNTLLKVDNDITLYAVLKVVPYINSTVTKSSTSCNIEMSIYNVSGTCNIIVSGYKNKQFVSLQSRPYRQEHETFILSNDIDEIKVMLWDGLVKLKPLCDAEVITGSQIKFIREPV